MSFTDLIDTYLDKRKQLDAVEARITSEDTQGQYSHRELVEMSWEWEEFVRARDQLNAVVEGIQLDVKDCTEDLRHKVDKPRGW